MPASVGTVYVDVKFNIGDIGRQLQAALSGVGGGLGGPGAGPAAALERTFSQSLTAIGSQAQAVGRQLTVGLTVPLALIGKSAVTAFKSFDESMTRISALNEVPIKQTEEWRGEVRELGLTYGVAADDVANALYFITSSGIESAKAMDVLEVAVKGSAVGLGETKVVADVLTSAINAYGEANITAAKAGDILTEAVAKGKGEADELAGALSQVIPLAANAGVSFGEVSGAMAAMTLSGTSADQAATQLRGLFNTLQDMPPSAQRALKAYTDIDYAQVKIGLSADGLIPTLKTIFDAFDKLGPVGKQSLAEVFGNIRALTGIMNLFGNNTARTLQIIRDVTNASGQLNDAWEITAQSKAKKLDIAMNRIHDSLVGIGADVVPAVTSVTNVLGSLASGFASLGDPIKSTAVALGLFAAAAGPATMAIGSMARGMGAIGSAITTVFPTLGRFVSHLKVEYSWLQQSQVATTGWIGKMGGLNQVLGVAGIAAGTAAIGFAIWSARMAEATQRAEALGKSLGGGAESGGIGSADSSIAKAKAQIEQLNKEMSASNLNRWNPLDLDYFGELGKYVNELQNGISVIETRKRLAGEIAQETQKETGAVYDWLAAEERAGRRYTTSKEAMDALAAAYLKGDEGAKKLATSSIKAADGLGAVISRAKETSDAFFGVVQAEDKQADAAKNVADAKVKVTDAERAYEDAKQKSAKASLDIVDAERKQLKASQDLTNARRNLTDAQNELNDALRGPNEDEKLDIESAQLGLEEARKRLSGKFEDPLDRRRAQLDVRRAQMDLTRAQGANANRIKDAQEGVRSAQDAVNDAIQAEVDARQAVVDARNAKADASRNEASADDARTTAKEGVTQAEKDLFDATAVMVEKQTALSDQIGIGATNGGAFLSFLEEMKKRYPEMAGVIDGYIQKFKDLQTAAGGGGTKTASDVLGGSITATEGNTGLSGFAAAAEWFRTHPAAPRAVGGPLSVGQLSTVNERGMPELWSAGGKQYLLPTTQGQVTPLKPLDVDVAARGGDGVSVGDVYVQGASDPVATAYEVRRQLRVKTRTKART
jgi:TP901 family phage tail tape measure protein